METTTEQQRLRKPLPTGTFCTQAFLEQTSCVTAGIWLMCSFADVPELSMLLTLTVILMGGRDSCWMSLFWGDVFFCSVSTKLSVPCLLLAYTHTWLQHGSLPWPGIAYQSLPECRYSPRQWNHPGFKSACPCFITTGVLFQKTNSTLERSITVIKKPP